MNRILFLCTGNFYRSRFAEHLFNHLAIQKDLSWRAESRGLRLNSGNFGPISLHALEALEQRGVVIRENHRPPIQVTADDLFAARRVVAVKQAEHLPLIQELFPTWTERVEYWHIHDVDFAQPEEALPELEREVVGLVTSLADES